MIFKIHFYNNLYKLLNIINIEILLKEIKLLDDKNLKFKNIYLN